MKSIIFSERGNVEILEEKIPEIKEDEILLKTLYSGLSNGTERNILLGQNYGKVFPTKAGYQLVSKVLNCGRKISKYSPGNIVYSGKCIGHCEYSIARENDLLAILPKRLSLEESALLGIASISHHNVQKVNVSESDNVLIFGAGLVGQFISQFCRDRGAKVTTTDLCKKRLVLAEQLGANNVILGETSETESRLGEDDPYSVVFECSGADVLETIIGTSEQKGLIDFKGNLLMIAGRNRVNYDFNAAQSNEITIIHTNHFDQLDLESTLTAVQTGKIKIRPLINDVIPIRYCLEIYKTLRDKPLDLMGTIFRW